MQRRLLSLLLAALMVLTSTLTLMPITANEADTNEPQNQVLSVEDLYVKNAVFMWDAFDMKASDATITAFENAVGEADIEIPATVTVTMGDGYVLYPSGSGFNIASLIPHYQAGSYKLPDDYTLEMTVHQTWDDAYTHTSARWDIAGMGTGASWGGQFNFTLQTPSDTQGYIKGQSTYFGTMNEDGTLKDDYRNTNKWTDIFANHMNAPYTVGWTHTASFAEGETFYPCTDIPLRDGALVSTLTRNHYMRQKYYDDLSTKKFVVGKNTPFAYYAIRIYPFALSEEQVAQNHFAELCDCFNIGHETLSLIASMDDTLAKTVFSAFTGKTVASFADTAAFEAAIAEAIDLPRKQALAARFDALYAEGATFRWDAFGMAEGDGSVTAFKNAVGDTDLSMSGTVYDKYVRSTSALDFTPLMTVTTDNSGNVINDDFTVEVVAKQIYDDEFAAVMKAGQHYTASGYLVRRWADTRMDISTKVPTKNEDGSYADGLIEKVPIVKIDVVTGKQSSWGSVAWLANPIDKIYSFGASLAFDETNEYPQFHISLIRDSAILKEADYKYTLSATQQKFGITDKNNVLCMGYYAIRAYNRVLEEDELAQNHFVDLIKYHGISEESLSTFEAFIPAHKRLLYRSFASVMLYETSKEALENAINAVGFNITPDFLTVNEIFLFDGYSSRLYTDPAIRASFTVDTANMKMGEIEITEMGTLSAMTGSRLLSDITVEKKDGTYAPTDADVAHNVIYENGEFIGKIGEDGKLTVTQTVSFDSETATKDTYFTDFYFRGYAVLKAGEDEFIVYTDMTSERFGDEVSMYELASDRRVAHHDLNKEVVMKCIENPEKKTFRILAIGNSFSLNSTEYLYNIAKSFGYEDIVIGVLYIAGCPISTHAANALSGAKTYVYHKYDNSASVTKETTSLTEGLLDEPWDAIITHQKGSWAGTESSFDTLGTLMDYVDEHKTNRNAKLYWMGAWSYANGHKSTNKDEPEYAHINDQDEFDTRITECLQKVVIPSGYFDGIIPSGKAIRNAREHFGKNFELYNTSDGYHLNGKGCVISGLTWFAAITGEDISGFTYGSLSEEELQAVISSVQNALKDPFYSKTAAE